MSAPARFFDGKRAVPHAVALTLSGANLEIRALDGSFTLNWPVLALAVRDRPGPDGAATLSLGRHPARLVTADPALLREIAYAAGGRHRRLLGGWWHHWGAALAGAVAALAACALAVDQAPALLAPLVPPSWADRLGAGVEAALTAGSRRCASAAGQQALDRLTGRLATAAGLDPPPAIGVIDDATVNALTLPGRRILVLSGLIAAAEDGDELAGVIGHELGHVAHRDPLQALLRAAGLTAIATALGWGDGGAGSAASLARAMAGAAYGRAAETAADAAAIAALRGAGLRADGLGRFFAALQRREAERGGHLPAWLSDHPPTADRAARVTQPAIGEPAFSGAEWAAVRTMCRGS